MKKGLGYLFYVIGGFIAVASIIQLLPFAMNFVDIVNEAAESEPSAAELGTFYGHLFSLGIKVFIIYILFKYGRKWTKNQEEEEDFEYDF